MAVGRPIRLTWPVLLALAALPLQNAEAALVAPKYAAVNGQTHGWTLVQATEAASLARLEVRLARIEEELRRLTGRIEETEYGQRQINRRIDELIRDLDARLAALEQGRQPTGSGGSTDDAADTPAAPTVPGPPAAEEGSLGTVPEGDLAALPRPDPDTATAPERESLPAREQYDSAMALLRAGDYPGAERGLELFVEINQDHALAPNAAYWLAETHYVQGDYSRAAAAFARNYRTYGSTTPKAPDNLLKLGMALHQLGQDEEACRAFEELDGNFPDPPAHIHQAVERERREAACSG